MTNSVSASLTHSGRNSRAGANFVKAKTYKLDGKTLRILVEYAGAWLSTPIGMQYSAPESRDLVYRIKRELGGFVPPTPAPMSKVVRAVVRPVPQLEATEKLASDAIASEKRRRELVIYGKKTG